mgnify:CR=1 FL=1
MPEELTAERAAQRLRPVDTLGIPLGPGQPPAFLRALGARADWTALQVYGALLAVGTELFSRPGVCYLSGFYGPLERALREAKPKASAISRAAPAFSPTKSMSAGDSDSACS